MSRTELRRGVAARVGGVGMARSAIVVLPLVVLPVLAGHVTRNEWIAIGVGQSLGALAAVVAGGGWALTGPPTVALGERDPRALFTDAVRSTTVLLLAVAPGAGLVTWMIAPDGTRLLAVLMTVAGATAGISPAWFLAVRGDIRWLLVADVGPRVAAGVTAAVIVARWGEAAVLWYPGLALVAGILGPGWYATRLVMRPDRRLSAVLVRQVVPMLTTLVAAGYSAAAVTLVAMVADAGDAAEFASGFRLYMVALAATVVVNQSTQQWARGGRGATPDERSVAFGLYLFLAVVLLSGFAALGAPTSRLLFGTEFAMGQGTAVAFGVAGAVLTLESYVTTHLVVPFGRHSEVFRAALAGAALGVPATLLSADRFGATGAAWSLVLSESTVTVVLLVFAARRRSAAVTCRESAESA